MLSKFLRQFSPETTKYHRSRNRGGGGGGGAGGARPPPPPIYKSGGPRPPNVGAIKGSLTVKMDFFIHIRAIFAKIF